MTAPKSLDAYNDCEEYFERAAKSEKGIAATMASPGLAVKFRQKMNAYRVLLRKKAKEIYPPDHGSYGTSPYDAYELSIDPDNDCRVLIRKYRIAVTKVEDL